MTRSLRIVGGELTLPASAVVDESVSSTADITVEKMRHMYSANTDFGLNVDDTPVAAEKIVFVAQTAGVIRGFHATLNDTGTSTNVSFDLKVNGSSVLSAQANITHSDADRAVKDGTLASASSSFSVDDVISISMTVSASSGAQGPFAEVFLAENGASS